MSKIVIKVPLYAVLEHDMMNQRDLAICGKDRASEIESDVRNYIKDKIWELRYPNGGVIKYGLLVGNKAIMERLT